MLAGIPYSWRENWFIFKDLHLIPEQLPGEPPRRQATSGIALIIAKKVLWLLVMCVLMPPFWLIYLPLRLLLGRPPSVPSFAQLRRYLGKTWTEQAPPPGIALSVRIRLFLELLRAGLCAPLTGLAWFLDDILYGRQLRKVSLTAPLFEISATRSGSTQLGHYLAEDPPIIAPMWLQTMFPYLWLWKLVSATLGRAVSRQRVRDKIQAAVTSPDFLQRHEYDPFRIDTLDIPFYILHLNAYARALGPATLRDDFSFGALAAHNRTLLEQDFVRYIDGLGRKAVLFAGPGPDGKPRRLLLKGHFLASADALERRYPDARFLTILREPVARIQSAVNFVAVTPDMMGLGPAPWSWCAEGVVQAEIDYCNLEMAWYRRKGARRCTVRFPDYVKDLEGTLRKIYRECLDRDELPPHLPRLHEKRQRTNYRVNRSLAQLGVDEGELKERLKEYMAWCNP
jgi:hypothetical protein